MTTIGVSPRLGELLAEIEVAQGANVAFVRDQKVEGSTPRELVGNLARALYVTLHCGREERDGLGPRTLRDRRLEERFTEATPHQATWLPVRNPRPSGQDGVTVVEIDGVRVAVPADAVLEPGESPHPGQVTLRVPSYRAALSPGFFLVDGSQGHPMDKPLLRVYVHVAEAEHAPRAWNAVLAGLEAANRPYRAKVCSSPLLYPRRDALVVYLGVSDWHLASAVEAAVRGLPGIGHDTSPFARRLAPGVGIACEPEDARPERAGMSFGEHRALALAEGLVAQAASGPGSSAGSAVAESLIAARIDPGEPARNSDSPEFPALQGVE
ncbi:hypothetical protein FH608_000830 [Nonomuraea phyllanthi]|uniref:Uncharacterized protein n=1 Tax=Nonomuraea phyllanthi TaxID=2219224 RepID=A0A5C4WWZ5_9ACTN|nr:T3SS effector HopA1 family protein [Nonomuraea phyllanthi]KAB8197148.1 hypothetical protein FH608_000830 [Nonomuraea phyllanthi]QFY06849.1 hypothetical protein GBF35_09210 [Nonomuraea phyllanthi]